MNVHYITDNFPIIFGSFVVWESKQIIKLIQSSVCLLDLRNTLRNINKLTYNIRTPNLMSTIRCPPPRHFMTICHFAIYVKYNIKNAIIYCRQSNFLLHNSQVFLHSVSGLFLVAQFTGFSAFHIHRRVQVILTTRTNVHVMVLKES